MYKTYFVIVALVLLACVGRPPFSKIHDRSCRRVRLWNVPRGILLPTPAMDSIERENVGQLEHTRQAKLRMNLWVLAMGRFCRVNKRYAISMHELVTFGVTFPIGSDCILRQPLDNDPWGTPYSTSSTNNEYRIVSAGADALLGTHDDLVLASGESYGRPIDMVNACTMPPLGRNIGQHNSIDQQ